MKVHIDGGDRSQLRTRLMEGSSAGEDVQAAVDPAATVVLVRVGRGEAIVWVRQVAQNVPDGRHDPVLLVPRAGCEIFSDERVPIELLQK